MAFKYCTEFDESTAKTMGGLVSKNNGFFKSINQSEFIAKRLRAMVTVEQAKTNFGIILTETQFIVEVNGMMRWADFGTKSQRMITTMFVCDSIGVVAKYKLHRNYSTCGRASVVDPSKTELLWIRPEDAVAPELVKIEKPVAVNEYIGEVGTKIEITGELMKVVTFERMKFGYYDSGVGYLAKIKTEQGIVVYWGFPVDCKTKDDITEGSKIKVRGTVKSHEEQKGFKQTVIQRPKFELI